MGVTWLKKGEAAAEQAKQEEVKQEARKAEMGKLWRFMLDPGQTEDVTFLDADVHPKTGALDAFRWYEHFVVFAGKWTSIFCPQQSAPESGEKCPLCETDRPSYMAGFTVIDHRVFKTKNGPSQHTRKLFVCKSGTYEVLNTLAKKRKGLTGYTVSCTRSTKEKAPVVGDTFDVGEKHSLAELAKTYTKTYKTKEGEKTENLATPADFSEEITVRTGEELRAMGFGNAMAQGQVIKPTMPKKADAETPADGGYEEQLG